MYPPEYIILSILTGGSTAAVYLRKTNESNADAWSAAFLHVLDCATHIYIMPSRLQAVAQAQQSTVGWAG